MILYFILFYFILFIYLINVWIKYDVWYTVVLIDYLRVIHTTTPFQAIPHQIG